MPGIRFFVDGDQALGSFNVLKTPPFLSLASVFEEHNVHILCFLRKQTFLESSEKVTGFPWATLIPSNTNSKDAVDARIAMKVKELDLELPHDISFFLVSSDGIMDEIAAGVANRSCKILKHDEHLGLFLLNLLPVPEKIRREISSSPFARRLENLRRISSSPLTVTKTISLLKNEKLSKVEARLLTASFNHNLPLPTSSPLPLPTSSPLPPSCKWCSLLERDHRERCVLWILDFLRKVVQERGTISLATIGCLVPIIPPEKKIKWKKFLQRPEVKIYLEIEFQDDEKSISWRGNFDWFLDTGTSSTGILDLSLLSQGIRGSTFFVPQIQRGMDVLKIAFVRTLLYPRSSLKIERDQRFLFLYDPDVKTVKLVLLLPRSSILWSAFFQKMVRTLVFTEDSVIRVGEGSCHPKKLIQ